MQLFTQTEGKLYRLSLTEGTDENNYQYLILILYVEPNLKHFQRFWPIMCNLLDYFEGHSGYTLQTPSPDGPFYQSKYILFIVSGVEISLNVEVKAKWSQPKKVSITTSIDQVQYFGLQGPEIEMIQVRILSIIIRSLFKSRNLLQKFSQLAIQS